MVVVCEPCDHGRIAASAHWDAANHHPPTIPPGSELAQVEKGMVTAKWTIAGAGC